MPMDLDMSLLWLSIQPVPVFSGLDGWVRCFLRRSSMASSLNPNRVLPLLLALLMARQKLFSGARDTRASTAEE
jgi:hypothetical protein